MDPTTEENLDLLSEIVDEAAEQNGTDNRNDDEEVATSSAQPFQAQQSQEIYDQGEEADAESEMSGDEQNNETGSAVATEGNTTKKRKKQDPNKRRKIRKLLTEDKLNKETLLAVQEEENRRKRLEDQAASNIKASMIDLMPEVHDPGNLSSFTPSLPSYDASFLASLLTQSDVSLAPKPVDTPAFKTSGLGPPPTGEVICISSDSSDEETDKKPSLDISSDSSDDVICTGEVVEEEPGMEEVNNSGMHTDDTMNQRDAKGRVLVNVNRPANEPEIFLAPQLAKAVLPHQIGGIRFMFDNLVETLSHHETSAGFGCILAHAMGLGKTLQVICFVDAFLRYTKARTVLCIVPVNTLMNWVAEFNMWLPMKSKCVNENPADVWPRSFTLHLLTEAHKTIDSRSKVVSQWYDEGGVLLLGYEMYRLLASRKLRATRRRKNAAKVDDPVTVNLVEQDRISNLRIGMQDSLLVPGPDLIICDEGHRIKNNGANISKVLKNVRTRRRLVLTGYPLQNNLMEYWCMVDFVRPNFLGTKNEFSNMFERPILNGQCTNSTEADVKLMRFRSHVLHSLLKGFVQRRSHNVLRDALPLKEEHVVMIRLSQWQKKLYNTFMRLSKEGASGSWCSSANPIKAFSICCKIWNHPDVLYRTVREKTDAQENTDLDPDFDVPDLNGVNSPRSTPVRKSPPNSQENTNGTSDNHPGSVSGMSNLSDDKEKGINYEWAKDCLAGYSPGFLELSGKMVVLMNVIQASVSRGDRVLIFSQSLSTLSLIEEFLSLNYIPRPEENPRKWVKNQSYFRLDGNTHLTERERMINQFNSPDNSDCWLFLLSTRAGCLGINLIGANRVVMMDASWNPCHDAQAVCRVYRYGQRKSCHIYRLICDQTMEKKIYERQISKQGMADRVVDKLNPAQVFSKQEVLKLLEYSDEELPKLNFDNVDEDDFDPILRDACKLCGHWMTRKPFRHESLLLDCKDQRLTKAEKRAAEKSYERDKLASSTYNYSRPSYAGFYGSGNSSLPKSNSTNSMPQDQFSSTARDGNRPIANVRPIQSTPLPMHLKSDGRSASNILPQADSGSQFHHKSGVTVQKVVATLDIPLPPVQSPSINTSGSQATSIKAGETYCVIRGKKGTYIRTLSGRIFSVRSNDASRFGNNNASVTSPALPRPPAPRMTSSISAPVLNWNGNNHDFRNSPTFPPPLFTNNYFSHTGLYQNNTSFGNFGYSSPNTGQAFSGVDLNSLLQSNSTDSLPDLNQMTTNQVTSSNHVTSSAAPLSNPFQSVDTSAPLDYYNSFAESNQMSPLSHVNSTPALQNLNSLIGPSDSQAYDLSQKSPLLPNFPADFSIP